MSRAHDAMRQVYDALDELVALVETARAMPLSASCVLPREQLLDLLDEIRAGLPRAFDDARELVAVREELIGQARDRRDQAVAQAQVEATAIVTAARAEADQVRAAARAEHEQLVSEAEVRRAAEAEARGVLQAATERADQLRTDADEYVDGQLAALSEALSRTLRTVERGREVLRERTGTDPPAPRRPTRPALPDRATGTV
jgi:cell division septum initiation protein DivIVA